MNITDEKTISRILTEVYGKKIDIVAKSAWGYTTAAYYARADQDELIVKVTKYSDIKLPKAEKDIYLSNVLHGQLPTPAYIQNLDGAYITLENDLLIKVAKYIEGTAPFDMNLEIYRQVLGFLEKMHKIPLDMIKIDLPVSGKGEFFLHGDFTASNIIVSHNKIVGILDFEDSLRGPKEYDLARSTVFCWYRMKDISFRNIAVLTLNNSPEINQIEFLGFCKVHAKNHLDQVITNKENYDNEQFWRDDYNFSKRALEEINTITI